MSVSARSARAYCPCGGTCHFAESPCSLGCVAHNADVRHRPMRALPDDATCVCLRSDDHSMHQEMRLVRDATDEPNKGGLSMEKIPTLFVRDDNERRYVTREVTPGCEWVINGEGVPTRKYDGVCVMYDGTRWWARREVKEGKADPPGFQPISTDGVTGKTVGWEPIEQSAFVRWHAQAIDGIAEQEPGTYELVGPRVNGNPEGEQEHRLVAHVLADVLDVPDRSYDGLAEFFAAAPAMEGIVFHHEDGRMVKIKRRDFRASR